ncbi:MAG: tetratricopeptide repeat protein [Proteobacteria bacterium]|nr:tetratricopeptide repeat protein [Pseudomonadota bacterium]
MDMKRACWTSEALNNGNSLGRTLGQRRKRIKGWIFEQNYRDLLKQYRNTQQTMQIYRRTTDLMDKYGQFMLQEADYDAALSAFTDAVDLAPNQVKCHNNLAVFYWYKGELEKAVHHLELAIKINPNDRETVWNCGQVMTIAGEPLVAKYVYNNYMKQNGYDQEMIQAIANL